MKQPKPLYRVYVDETGDRGWSGRSSDFFVLSAIVIADEHVPRLEGAIDSLVVSLGKPAETALHWAENIKDHASRKLVARTLGGLPITLMNVLVMKSALMGSQTRLKDADSMYNYAVRRLLERISWYAKERHAEASVTFAHVRRFPYDKLYDYMGRLRRQDTNIVWETFTGRPKIDQPKRVRALQVADLAAGCLWTALKPDRHGDYETAYLREIYRLIHVRPRGRVTSYGMNIVGPDDCMAAYPWWDRFVRACEQNTR